MTEPVTPDGLRRKRVVRSYSDDDPTPRVADQEDQLNDPYGDAAEDATLFPPGLLPPSAPRAPTRQHAGSSLSPYHQYSHQTIRAPDGQMTRMYWVRAGTALTKIIPLIQAHTRATEAMVGSMPAMETDPRPLVPFPANTRYFSEMPPGVAAVSDLILVTASEDILLEVDQFLSALLTETPQIEIEARVVEITFEDGLEVGANLIIKEREPKYTTNEDGTKTFTGKGQKGGTLFSQFKSPLDPNAYLSGGQVGSLVLSIFENDIKFHAILRAIQNSVNTDVLSAPKMAVLNGHRAIIDTGARTPVFTPVIGSTGNVTTLTIKYENTGITLIVTPYLLMDDMIQVDVLAEVSFVSGFVDSSATGILNPIFSERTASTIVNVRDGQTFGIGGLTATDEIELVTKVPILGDIPILGYLFKTKAVTERQSQVIFFITPRLLTRQAPVFDPGG
ncbi:MAG: type II and III secretion system protein [Planctomycetota bacterium]